MKLLVVLPGIFVPCVVQGLPGLCCTSAALMFNVQLLQGSVNNLFFGLKEILFVILRVLSFVIIWKLATEGSRPEPSVRDPSLRSG